MLRNILLIAVLLCGPLSALEVGSTVPLPVLKSAQGAAVNLRRIASVEKKKNLLLVFFRTGTCGICVHQLEEIAERRKEIQSAGTAIVAISLDDAIIQKRVSDRINYAYPILLDPEAKLTKAMNAYNPAEKLAFPSTFLIDANGKLLFQYIGKSLQDRPPTAQIVELARHYSGKLPTK